MKGSAANTLAFACSFTETLAGIMFFFTASEVMAAQNHISDFEQEFTAGKLAAGRSAYIEAAEHFIKARVAEGEVFPMLCVDGPNGHGIGSAQARAHANGRGDRHSDKRDGTRMASRLSATPSTAP